MKYSHLRRLYINDDFTSTNDIMLTKKQMHYLVNVLRLKNGDVFRIFNEYLGEYLARLSIASKIYIAKVIEQLRQPYALPYLCLAQSVIKNDKMTQSFDMATQVGVTEIWPIISARSQSQTINTERMTRCLIEATEQSERLSAPILKESISLEHFLQSTNFDMIIYANEHERTQTMSSLQNIPAKVVVLIGPEGGLTDQEIAMLHMHHNTYSVSLGDIVLRSETATIALLAQLQLLRSQPRSKINPSD